MAVPVIDPIIFISLTEDVAMSPPVTPLATEFPTSWTATGLPAGLSCASGSGKISGTPTETGAFAVSLVATNGSGDSAPMKFYIGVSPSAAADEGLLQIDLDLQTGLARNSSIAAGEPLFLARNGDKVPVALGIVRDSSLRTLAITNLKITVRDNYGEGENAVALYNAAPAAPLDAAFPRYRALLDFTPAGVLDMINEHDADSAQGGSDYQLAALCEIVIDHTITSIGGVTTAVRSSVNFSVHLARHLAEPA